MVRRIMYTLSSLPYPNWEGVGVEVVVEDEDEVGVRSFKIQRSS